MANVLTVVWGVIFWVVMQTSIMVWAALMLPKPVARAKARIESRPFGTFWMGLAFWVGTLVFVTTMLKQGRPAPLQIMGWLSAAPMLLCSVLGGAAFAQIMAARIREHAPSCSPVAALAGGALCTALAGLLPVIGWVVFLPVVSFISIGAGLFGLLGRKRELVFQSEVGPAAPAWPSGAESTAGSV